MAMRIMRPNSALAYASLSSLIVPVSGAITSSGSSSHPGSSQHLAPPFTCRSSPFFSSASQQQCASYSTSTSHNPPSGSVSYRIAVSYCGKGRKVDASRDVTAFDLAALRSQGQSAVAGAPPRSGQDAFFMGALGSGGGGGGTKAGRGAAVDGDLVFGVADGVGGWTDSGIYPSAFSEGLCRHMAAHAGGWDEEVEGALSPLALLQAGYDGTTEDADIIGGGSTAVVGIARRSGLFEVANLGDSGFVHYRPNATVFASPPQVHAFNTPYQLSLIPQHILERSRMFGGEPLHDYPSDAAVTQHMVAHGDVLVFGTDGVWDNLNSGDVLEIVRKEMDAAGGWVIRGGADGKGEVVGGLDLEDKTDWRRSADEVLDKGRVAGQVRAAGGKGAEEDAKLVSIQEKLAFKIVKSAQMAAVDMKRTSPFGRELKRWYPNEQWRGGKVDDIAVIVAVVVAN